MLKQNVFEEYLLLSEKAGKNYTILF